MVYAKICTLSAQTCESWPAKRNYTRRPDVRWLRTCANCVINRILLASRSTLGSQTHLLRQEETVESPIPFFPRAPPNGGEVSQARVFCPRCCPIRIPPRQTCVSKGLEISRSLLGRVTGRVCEKMQPPPRQNVGERLTCENMHWRLPGSGLRKYALRENHTIPV